jgi:hypothetical protein
MVKHTSKCSFFEMPKLVWQENYRFYHMGSPIYPVQGIEYGSNILKIASDKILIL